MTLHAPTRRELLRPRVVRLRPAAFVRLICALALHVSRCLNWTKLRSYAPLVVTVNVGRLRHVSGSFRNVEKI